MNHHQQPSLPELFRETLHREALIQPGDKLIIGVSGGADSICLLHLFKAIQSDYNLEIHIAHLNHQLRGKTAVRDAEFVQNLAHRYKLKYHHKSVNIKTLAAQTGKTLEEAGRIARYRFFQQLAQRYHISKVVVAHHGDDLAETLLMRLIRGTGPEGLIGMTYQRPLQFEDEPLSKDPVSVIRPLLGIYRRDILNYLKEHKLRYREDATNQDMQYLRNKTRLQLIPLLEQEYNPRIKELLCRTASILMEEEKIWTQTMEEFYKKNIYCESNGSWSCPVSSIVELPLGLQRRVLRYCIEKKQGHLHQIGFEHIESILGMLTKQGALSSLELPGSLAVSVKKDKLLIHAKKKPSHRVTGKVSIQIPGTTDLPGYQIQIKTSLCPLDASWKKKIQSRNIPTTIAVIDADAVRTPLNIRHWKPGDRMIPLGMQGTKKLQDIFVNRKIPVDERGQIPVLCDRDNIVWVVGIQVSELVKVIASTRNLLVIEMEKMNSE